jgi:lipoprotein-anchoring transpeptidase ErfK/SrfK
VRSSQIGQDITSKAQTLRSSVTRQTDWNSRRSAALLIASLHVTDRQSSWGQVVKRSALILLIIGNVVAAQAYADSVLTQPLTRADCESAGLAWNDNANVCGSASQEAKITPKPQPAEGSGQPLTRSDCDKAGMTWNDSSNVCGEKSKTQAAAKTTDQVPSTILINIDKATQEMTVFLDGVERYNWPVSTGMTRYATPSGTYTATSMNEIWYSKEWDNAPMPHAIFFMKDGHAIHGSYEVKSLGRPVSHGCVRIAPQNAATLYALVAKTGLENTHVVLAGVTPGGEGKVVASRRGSGSRYGQTVRRSPKPSYYYFRPGGRFAESDIQPQRRGGFFRRLFGRQ